MRFRKGDRIRIELGFRFVEWVVKEDIGPIGVKGRRLYGVTFRMSSDAEELSYIELPAVKIELVPEATPAP